MRTYSHVLLTLAAARQTSSPAVAACASAGAALPDLPALAGGLWLRIRRKVPFTRERFDEEVCGRRRFRVSDAALHSALPVVVALAFQATPGRRGRDPRKALLAFLLGWTGHVAADAMTHAGDGRPLLWPLLDLRFQSPVSYWDPEHHGRAFAVVEHAALLAAVLWLIVPFQQRHSGR